MKPRAEFWRRGPLGRAHSPEIMFGQVREDTSYERSLATGSCLCIASGGETAFDLLMGGADRVLAVDVNPAQIYLVQLKQEVSRSLDRSEAVEAFTRDGQRAWTAVRARLPNEAVDFFSTREHDLSRGLLNCGKVDVLLSRLMRLFFLAVHPHGRVVEMLSAAFPEEQKTLFARRWNTPRWRIAMSAFRSRHALALPFGGEAIKGVRRADLLRFREDIDHVLRDVPAKENPYVWQAMLGRYPEGWLPDWLSPEGFPTLMSRLDALDLATADVADVIESGKTFDRIFLSNITDVTSPEFRQRLAKGLAAGMKPGGLAVARSFFGACDLVERSGGTLIRRPVTPWTDRSFFCRNLELLAKAE